jgi:hypothetical protein
MLLHKLDAVVANMVHFDLAHQYEFVSRHLPFRPTLFVQSPAFFRFDPSQPKVSPSAIDTHRPRPCASIRSPVADHRRAAPRAPTSLASGVWLHKIINLYYG